MFDLFYKKKNVIQLHSSFDLYENDEILSSIGCPFDRIKIAMNSTEM